MQVSHASGKRNGRRIYRNRKESQIEGELNEVVDKVGDTDVKTVKETTT